MRSVSLNQAVVGEKLNKAEIIFMITKPLKIYKKYCCLIFNLDLYNININKKSNNTNSIIILK